MHTTCCANPNIGSISVSSGGIGTTVTISGSNFGAIQAGSTVTFNGVAATVISWSDGTIVVRVPEGLNPGSFNISVNVAGTGSNGVQFTVTPPLHLVPSAMTLVIGEDQHMQILDPSGALLTGASWQLDDSTIAQYAANPDPDVAALALGQTKLRAFLGNQSGEADVTVVSALQPGDKKWSIAGDGSAVTQIIPAVPAAGSDTDVFALGASGNLLAITSDGNISWTAHVGQPQRLLPDFQGGMVTVSSAALNRLDATGHASATYPYATFAFAHSAVVHPDGTIFTIDGDKVIAVDSTTGAVKFNVAMRDTVNTTNGASSTSQPALTSLIVAGDGNAYVGYWYWVTDQEGSEVSGTRHDEEHLRILSVSTDGTSSDTGVGDWSQDASWTGHYVHLDPGKYLNPDDPSSYQCPWWADNGCDVPIIDSSTRTGNIPYLSVSDPITNADQGIALSWGEQSATGTAFVSHLTTANSSSVISQANVNAPGQMRPFDVFWPSLQTSDGSYIGTAGSNGTLYVTALDSNGNQLWSSSIGRGSAQPQYVLADGSVVTQQWDSNGNGPFEVTYDANGSVIQSPPGADATFSWRGAYKVGSVDSFNLQAAPLALTFAAVNGGNLAGNGAAMQHHSFGLFWCGTGYLEIGHASQCTDDITFSYIANPTNANISQAQDFSTAHGDWVGLLEASALKAYQKAFASVPILVNLGSHHNTTFGQAPDQDFIAYVVGTWPAPASGLEFPGSGAGRIYYLGMMDDAQTALGYPTGQGTDCGQSWCNFTPAYPPSSSQDNAGFQKLVKAIGGAIGNAAAHEAGHYLQRFTPQFPLMDCGAGAYGIAIVAACENNDNFVYNFWSATGLPQDPADPTSNGGQFFYLDTPGHPIHWGPANDCWLKKWVYPKGKDCN